MQSKGLIKFVAIIFLMACLYQLSFTWKTYSVEKDAVEYAKAFSNLDEKERDAKERHYLDSVKNQPVYNLGLVSFTYQECKERELNLGLDLRGGMNVMLEIEVKGVVEALAGDNKKDSVFVASLAAADEATKKGEGDYIEIMAENYKSKSNGKKLVNIFFGPDSKFKPGMSDEEVVEILQADADAAIETSFNIIRSRIDRFGVTQPNIQRLPNSNRILIELPGVKEPERVRKLLQGSASLEFWTTYNAAEIIPGLQEAASKVLVNNGVEDTASESLFNLLDMSAAYGAVVGAAEDVNREKISNYLALPEVRESIPSNVAFKWAIKADSKKETVLRDGTKQPNPYYGKYYLYAIKVENLEGKAPLDGSVITDARANYAERGSNAEVSMSMNSKGVSEWARLTGDNIGKSIAIVLDDHVYSAPTVQNKIEGGNSSITGDFTIKEAEDLANVLKSGKVPAPAKIIQDSVVGPSLGQEAINSGLLSFVLAFVLVLIYMGLFYRTAGWISDIALIINVFFLMGCLVSFGAVLTLPGIAGIVLTMGMAVDANVIIYERIKEELRGGKSIYAAIKDGYSNAYSAIIDGNLTTIITGIVLFIFGNGPVQGFATTLVIGILTSMFTSIFITRLIIDKIVAKRGKLSFSYKWSENLLSNVKFDFIGKRFWAYCASGLVILAGACSLAFHGLNLGVEFTGGRSFVVCFDKPTQAEEVRKCLEGKFVGADASSVSCEVKQFDNDNQVRITTQYKFDDTSENATKEVQEIIYNAVKHLYSYDITFEAFSETQADPNGIVSADKIGPAIAKDMTTGAAFSVLFALIAMGVYIVIRFRRWQWALGATFALIHDAFMIVAVFSLFYSVMPFALEVNQAFIAAILTIIGYSINDTVVIFDRIREYIGLYPKRQLKDTINVALSSTLMRTLNTSGTTLVTLMAIFIFGGESIRGFVFALIVGIVVGTYSSLFIASPLAYDMQRKNRNEEK